VKRSRWKELRRRMQLRNFRKDGESNENKKIEIENKGKGRRRGRLREWIELRKKGTSQKEGMWRRRKVG
jgi:hypothetical protein